MDLTAIRVTGEGECHGQLTPLPPLLQRIMELLGNRTEIAVLFSGKWQDDVLACWVYFLCPIP